MNICDCILFEIRGKVGTMYHNNMMFARIIIYHATGQCNVLKFENLVIDFIIKK